MIRRYGALRCRLEKIPHVHAGEYKLLLRQLGMPNPKPPYPNDVALFGKPTVFNNVETLVNVLFILSEKPDKFRSIKL